MTRQGVILKSPREVEFMRDAGRVVYRVLHRMQELCRPGMTTLELNAEAERMITEAGAKALFKGVEAPKSRFPFPAALCTSVNDVVVHGIPNDRPLREGEILSVDCGVRLKGYCGDAAVTIPIGHVSERVQRLLDVTEQMLGIAIREMKPGKYWSEISRMMQQFAEGHGFSVVREFVGHGIGQQMHEDPKVPNYWDRKQAKHDFELLPGLVLAVEPMVNMGRPEVEYGDQDGWAVVTKDHRWAAHFEHTIAVTEHGNDVLTDGR